MITYWTAWRQKSRYRDVLRVCFPLVLGISATTVMEFTDRLFLANYSLNAIAAAAPAGITAFLFMSLFGGIGAYSSVFIAQYIGSGKPDKVGLVLWQSIYFCLFSGIILVLISFLAGKPIFEFAGHSQEIQALEEVYFSILCRGAIFHVTAQTLSGFFTGRGHTKPVMYFTILGMSVNIPLDYALIFGAWGFPEMGIKGAAIATVVGWLITSVCLAILIFTRRNIHLFKLYERVNFDLKIFLRLMKYGIPGALQFSLDILAFTIFILMVGRIGKLELAVTNIVIAINSVAFMPAMGVSHGISSLVGQALGKKDPDLARHFTWSSAHLLLVYILVIDLFFIFTPQQLLALFIPPEIRGEEYLALQSMGVSLLRIVSIYLLFDALYMVFSGTLKGAGDTRFIMYSVGGATLLCMIMPLYIGIEYLHFSVLEAWLCVLGFILSLFTIVSLRYKKGKWKKMLVI